MRPTWKSHGKNKQSRRDDGQEEERCDLVHSWSSGSPAHWWWRRFGRRGRFALRRFPIRVNGLIGVMPPGLWSTVESCIVEKDGVGTLASVQRQRRVGIAKVGREDRVPRKEHVGQLAIELNIKSSIAVRGFQRSCEVEHGSVSLDQHRVGHIADAPRHSGAVAPSRNNLFRNIAIHQYSLNIAPQKNIRNGGQN